LLKKLKSHQGEAMLNNRVRCGIEKVSSEIIKEIDKFRYLPSISNQVLDFSNEPYTLLNAWVFLRHHIDP
jgi:hypothetical protein